MQITLILICFIMFSIVVCSRLIDLNLKTVKRFIASSAVSISIICQSPGNICYSNADELTNQIVTISSTASASSTNLETLLDSKEVFESLKRVYDAIKDASTIDNFNSFIAITAAESIAGAVAGLSSRKFADLLKDKKRDTILTKLGSTSIFFGSRSFFRALTQLIGVPRPVSLLIGSLSGSLFSESAKFIGRVFAENDDIMSTDLISNSNRTDMLSYTEIYSDITKWLVFDELEGNIHIPDVYILRLTTYFTFGAIASFASYLVKFVGNKKVLNENETLSKDVLEGGVLFVSYEVIEQNLMAFAPPVLNAEMPFYKVLDVIESELPVN